MTGEPQMLLSPLPPLWNPTDPRSPEQWQTGRRAEVIDLYEQHVYGRTPVGGRLAGAVVLSDVPALEGTARRREVRLDLAGPRGERSATMLVYSPAGAAPDGGWPAFLGLNLLGNHSTTFEDDIPFSRGWIQFSTTDRGDHVRRWPYAAILERGYAVATMAAGEIEGDYPRSGFEGVRGMFATRDELLRPEDGDPSAWGTIGAWSFGLSRALDALGTLGDIDAGDVYVHGHSRLGKAALWTAAQDPRFAGAISNDSGCAGASLFRHAAGEDVRAIVDRYAYWFAPRFATYTGRDAELPVDQHLLIAAILPTPVHVASAVDDLHADPRGEFLSTVYASPIAELFGGRGTASSGDVPPLPPAPASVGDELLSYHLRSGGHDVLAEDWFHFLDFADRARAGRSQRPARIPHHPVPHHPTPQQATRSPEQQ